MAKRVRDAVPGATLAAIGVIDFAWRLRSAREPVDLSTGLTVGFATVVIVRAILGMLSSGSVALVAAGTAIGFGEMLFLLNFHVDSLQSLGNFLVCAVADLLMMACVWSLLDLAGSARRRLRRRGARTG